jgi:hypothetical protein
MEAMATVHMSEAEVARDLHAVLAKVRQGVEIVIEQDHRPFAVLKSSPSAGRLISEIVADLKARGSKPSWMTTSPAIPRKASRPSVSHGIHHPGSSARFERTHRRRTALHDRRPSHRDCPENNP